MPSSSYISETYMSKITVELNKKTLQEVYNQVGMLNDMGFPNFQKGEPINNLMREIKKDLKNQKKEQDFTWKDFLEFWPMSIVVPGMLLLILWGSISGQ
jgi:hypothetical protein